MNVRRSKEEKWRMRVLGEFNDNFLTVGTHNNLLVIEPNSELLQITIWAVELIHGGHK